MRSVALRLWESELEACGLVLRNFGDRGQGLVTTTARREGDILCDLDKQFQPVPNVNEFLVGWKEQPLLSPCAFPVVPNFG